jgi:Flp pilus assembly protein TadB
MFALLNGVPVISNPVFRIVLGAALIVIAVALLHDSIILIAIGALILIMGLVRGYRSLTRHNQEEEAR